MFEPKYLDVADKLESKIVECNWRGRIPGLATLGREFGVNSRTVSKALRVLEEKGRVEIKQSSGTFVRREERQGGRPYGTIGVLGMMHAGKKLAELAVVTELAEEKGYHVLGVEHCGEVFHTKPGVLLNIPVDGFIFTNSVLTPSMVHDLKRAEIPFVSLNRITEPKGVNWVGLNHEKSYASILERLLALGHRRIANVSFHATVEEHNQRMRGIYHNVLQPKGLFDPALYIDDGDMHEFYKRYGEHYFSIYGMEKASYLMNVHPRPTAVILNTPAMAHGFCNQIQNMGLKVPADVSVVATSQREQEAERETFLTMLAGSICNRVRRATEILLDILESPHHEPVQELMDMNLMMRESMGPCKS